MEMVWYIATEYGEKGAVINATRPTEYIVLIYDA